VIRLDDLPPPPEEATRHGLRFGPLEDEYFFTAQELAARAHSHNHFAYDPALSDDLARHLFKEQLIHHRASARAKIFAAYDQESQLVGFIVANRVQSFLPFGGPLLANLDFICVDPENQHRGLGHALNLTALRWLYEEGVRRVSVRTMVGNFAAQAILSRVGWRAMLAESVYHAQL
ncbi:MAG: GNAT family N-acetyltransferase, partial [Myxococcota bacterium]|nr:GNAT family N-acetyltransferase [Myxococcota bacterium]